MEKNDLRKAVNRYYSYVSSIYGFQLFLQNELQIYPYTGTKLTSLSQEWIKRSSEQMKQKGGLYGLGEIHRISITHKHYSFAIKSMRLVNDSFKPGGI